MSISRRKFLARATSVAAAGCAGKAKGFAQSTMASAATTQKALPRPSSEAGKMLYAEIGDDACNVLHQRLAIVNADIKSHGLRKIKGLDATFLTGYPYNEFYDWDLYFENLYHVVLRGLAILALRI